MSEMWFGLPCFMVIVAIVCGLWYESETWIGKTLTVLFGLFIAFLVFNFIIWPLLIT